MKKRRLIRKIACILVLILGVAAWFSYENNALTTTAYTIKSRKTAPSAERLQDRADFRLAQQNPLASGRKR